MKRNKFLPLVALFAVGSHAPVYEVLEFQAQIPLLGLIMFLTSVTAITFILLLLSCGVRSTKQ